MSGESEWGRRGEARQGKKWTTRIKKTKTYNRRDSQMVTHSSTSRPVQCLCMAERTGCPVFTDLWSYVLIYQVANNITRRCCEIASHTKSSFKHPIFSISLLPRLQLCNANFTHRLWSFRMSESIHSQPFAILPPSGTNLVTIRLTVWSAHPAGVP